MLDESSVDASRPSLMHRKSKWQNPQAPDPGVSMLVPNITPGGEPGSWTEAQFFTAVRAGVKPDGQALNADLMPWPQIGKSTDDELKAIWMYMKSVPAVAK